MNVLRALLTTIAAFWQPVISAEPTPDHPPSTREQMIEELLAIEQQGRVEAVASRRRLDALGAELQATERHRATQHHEIEVEQGHRMQRSFETDARLTRVRKDLAAAAPIQLSAFVESVTAEIERLCLTHSMEEAVTGRLNALRHAREHAEILRTAPLPMATILTELGRLEQRVADKPRESRHQLVAGHS